MRIFTGRKMHVSFDLKAEVEASEILKKEGFSNFVKILNTLKAFHGTNRNPDISNGFNKRPYLTRAARLDGLPGCSPPEKYKTKDSAKRPNSP